ncbi:VOC family protein [Burkholderia gladioli]|uniref:VOC family protein n=2 Tax=Burkholderiaceae TaxID=119060 RepID=UPI001FC8D288|nr:VOC family protein [Burkholderia gladioli]
MKIIEPSGIGVPCCQDLTARPTRLGALSRQELAMKFASIRVATRNLEGLIAFYQQLSGLEATRLADGFAEIRFGGATLALSAEQLIERFNAGAAVAASNRSAILEFEVDDVDAVFARMRAAQAELVMPATVMPWGNRSLLLRDPDGNLVNVFSRPARQAN